MEKLGKRLYFGFRAEVGDYILNDITGERWTAITCSNCQDGNVSVNHVIHTRCPICSGTKIDWRKGETTVIQRDTAQSSNRAG